LSISHSGHVALCPFCVSFRRVICTASNTWCLGSARGYSILNDISIGTSVFAGFALVTSRATDRQTDHATPFVGIGRIQAVCAMLRRKNPISRSVSHRPLFRVIYTQSYSHFPGDVVICSQLENAHSVTTRLISSRGDAMRAVCMASV